MSNAHHKSKQRRDLQEPGIPPERLSAKARARAAELAETRRAVEATMHFEDAEVTDGDYQQKPLHPVSLQRSLMGGSLR